MAQMLFPRVSQNLPTPKCSTCGQYVPLEQLGDHICPIPPPLPKPLTTPAVLLPKFSQSRTPSPASAVPSSVSPPSRMLTRLPQSDNLRALSNATTARPILHPQPLGLPTRNTSSPSLPVLAQGHSGTPPLGYRGLSVPRSGTPASMLPGNMIPPRDMSASSPQRAVDFSGPTSSGAIFPQVHSPPQSFVPPPERGIDTKTGGAAGMAGVGRRGFAAAARAAMFSLPSGRPLEPQDHRQPTQPKHLDPNVISRPTEAAPPSASSYSSRSPGLGSPLPQSEFPSQLFATNMSRTPSPVRSTPTQPDFSKPASPNSPLATRFPFFEKFKKIPGINTTSDSPSVSNNDPSISPLNSSTSGSISIVRKNTSDSTDSASLYRSTTSGSTSIVRKNTSDSIDSASLYRSTTSGSTSIVRKNISDPIDSAPLYRSTTSSTTSSRSMKDVRRPISPIDSESEYGGLAYADSTDTDSKNSSRPDMPAFILRTSSPRRHHRPSGSDASQNSNDRIRQLNHSRTSSTSSLSSGGSRSLKSTANSAVIAQALGLSQTPPSDYGKIGGPGVMGGKNGSISRRNARPDSMKEMEKAMEEARIKTRNRQPSSRSSSQRSLLYRADTTSSIASSRKDDDFKGSSGLKTHRSNTIQSPKHSLLYRADTTSSTTSSRKDDEFKGSGNGLKAHRSNTIQSPRSTSPEKAVKLPMRALTSPKLERDKSLDGTGVRKEKVGKAKVCLKCQKVIDNGRWVSVDGGGVLCERCWKNMYLPKCRRCNLSIEKQAVSSSDGQLKGKYHKECFNCDTCHKPFPDKSFYVYDGKPLCAYHYHEANDSLCAAARCGQPIEGPCAVSHSGDRYHPEHMTCEYSGYPSCQQMLSEYWEIDGRMLCERHANSASVRGSDEGYAGWTKSKKRVTRFIDLTGGAGGDSELR